MKMLLQTAQLENFKLLFSGKLYVIFVFAIIYECSNAFNLSPKPNIRVEYNYWAQPKTASNTGSGIPQYRSSYFGFSLILKRNR